MKVKNYFTWLKTIGFFTSGGGIALNAATTKASNTVAVYAATGSMCGTGINFAFESLEYTADIADRREAIFEKVTELSNFKEDIQGVALTSSGDGNQLNGINQLIERASNLFVKTPYFSALIESGLHGFLSITSSILYCVMNFNKDDDPKSCTNFSCALVTGLFLSAQFMLHFSCMQKVAHFAQETKNLHEDLTRLGDDICFLEWEHEMLRKKISAVQDRLGRLATQNMEYGIQLKNCRGSVKTNEESRIRLLENRLNLKKRKDDISESIETKLQQPISKVVELEQKRQDEITVLQKEQEQLDKEIDNIDTRQKQLLDDARERLEKEQFVLSQKIEGNNKEITKNQLLKESLERKIIGLHSVLTQRAIKCEEEHEKLRGFLLHVT